MPVEEWNKERLCADRLSNLNSLKLAVSTRHRLHVFIQEEGALTANVLTRTAAMEMDMLLCPRETVSFI